MPNDNCGDDKGKVESTSRTVAVQCPHCVADGKEEWETWIEVDRKDFNCKIFRHGIMRFPYEKGGLMVSIPPHASKQLCDELAAKNMIIGCGRPYRLVVEQARDACAQATVKAVACGYV
jgi:hypothetical protein